LRIHSDVPFPQTGELHLRRIFIFDNKRSRTASVVLDANLYVCLGADGKPAGNFAIDANTVWQPAGLCVNDGEKEQGDVVR
jgi:hypothetical protein